MGKTPRGTKLLWTFVCSISDGTLKRLAETIIVDGAQTLDEISTRLKCGNNVVTQQLSELYKEYWHYQGLVANAPEEYAKIKERFYTNPPQLNITSGENFGEILESLLGEDELSETMLGLF